MKNKIYLVGLISLSLTVLGGIFKIMHWPGAGWLLVFGYGSLSFVFFPLALRSSFVGDGKKRVWLYAAAFIALFADFLGALFKIMHWPGAGWMLIFGITFPVIVFLPVYIYFHVKEKEKSLVNFMYIMFLLVYLGVMSAFMAVRVQKEVLDDAIRVTYISNNEPYYSLKNKSFNEFDNVSEIKSKASELIRFIDELKEEVVLFSDDNQTAIAENGSINLWQVKGKDDFNIPAEIMIENGKGLILKNEMGSFREWLIHEVVDGENNPELSESIHQCLETPDHKLPDGTVYPWESFNFEHRPLIFVLNTLETLQNDIYQAETEVLTYLSHKNTR